MITKYRQVILLVSILSVIGCTDQDPRFIQLEEAMRLSDGTVDKDFFDVPILFIIPNGGCEGCITSAEAFVIDNIEQFTSFRVIFTGTKSQKALRLKIKEDIYNHSRVFIDKSNLFYSSDLLTMYPTIAYMEDGKVTKIDYMSKENPFALDSLISELTSY